MPFGFDGALWRLMGDGIEWMIRRGAVGREPAGRGRAHERRSAPGRCCFARAGLLLWRLLRSPLRWSGALVIAAASVWAARAPRAGRVWWRMARRRRGARRVGRSSSCMRPAMTTPRPARNGSRRTRDARDADDRCSLRDGVNCDPIGCVARLADGAVVALPCAAEVVRGGLQGAPRWSSASAPRRRHAMRAVIDRTVWPRTGATALDRRARAGRAAARAAGSGLAVGAAR